MKIRNFFLQMLGSAILTLAIIQAHPAFAQDHHHESQPASYESPSSSYSSMDHKWGLGVATFLPGALIPGTGALTGWIGITPEFGIEPLVDISGTNSFQFAVGALAKYTVVNVGAAGFHIGGGLTLGSVNSLKPTTLNAHDFLFGLTGLMGVHFTIPGTSNIVAAFDGGPMLNITGGTANFILEPLSVLAGFSVMYLF